MWCACARVWPAVIGHTACARAGEISGVREQEECGCLFALAAKALGNCVGMSAFEEDAGYEGYRASDGKCSEALCPDSVLGR